MSDEDLFGSDDEMDMSSKAPVSLVNTEEYLADQDDEAVVSNRTKKNAHFNDDDDDNDAEIVRESVTEGEDKSEFDGLFGEESKSTAVEMPRSTSTLRITKTDLLPEKKHINDQTILVRMPNVLEIQDKPFDENTYSKDEDMESVGRLAMGIRWRFKLDSAGNSIIGADGKPEIESNAKLVKLKNGAVQIVVGNNTYECLSQPLENR